MAEKILITGGAGFIGRHLCSRLAEDGYSLRVIDNLSPQVHGPKGEVPRQVIETAEFIRGDIGDRGLMKKALEGIDVVIHLAAETGMGQSQYEISNYYQTNVQSLAGIFDILVRRRQRLPRWILASTCRVYGEGAYQCDRDGRVYPPGRDKEQLDQGRWEPSCPVCSGRIQAVPNQENAPVFPTSVYAGTKWVQEMMILTFARTHRIPAVILRYQNVYGSGQAMNNPYTGIISIFASRILNGREPLIYEDGRSTRDFVHVRDVAEATRLSLKKKEASGNIFNVGSGKNVSIIEIAKMVVHAFGRDLVPKVTAEFRVGDIRHCSPDLGKAREILGYVPRYSLMKGIEEFVAWAKKQTTVADASQQATKALQEVGLLGCAEREGD